MKVTDEYIDDVLKACKEAYEPLTEHGTIGIAFACRASKELKEYREGKLPVDMITIEYLDAWLKTYPRTPKHAIKIPDPPGRCFRDLLLELRRYKRKRQK